MGHYDLTTYYYAVINHHFVLLCNGLGSLMAKQVKVGLANLFSFRKPDKVLGCFITGKIDTIAVLEVDKVVGSVDK